MAHGIRLLVSGDYACFTRPEMKAERVSYDVITPSAARGMLESVYRHPWLTWVIDKITVLNEIKFDSVRRNELGNKTSVSNVKNAINGGEKDLHQVITDDRQQRATLLLRNVAYVIDAHFAFVRDKMVDGANEGKVLAQFCRRAKNGQCYNQPYLGCREFAANFSLIEDTDTEPESFYAQAGLRDLGWMLWDMKYKALNEDTKTYEYTPNFFRAEMQNGVIDVRKAVML
jgi:CRISPR-associated protein Cas5 subtype I-C